MPPRLTTPTPAAPIRYEIACHAIAAGARRLAGITLVEMMLAVAIIAILAAIAMPMFQGYLERTNIAQAQADIKLIQTRIADYELDNNALPDSLVDIGCQNMADPWGNPYQYLNLGDVKGKGKARKDHALVPINSDYDLYSMGRDGKSVSPLTAKASRDDIVRGRNGQFIGLASDF
ncbi:MAG: prepilin-type N-terminal cleavage/methylation domain-containing protein [Rhodocyclaceae bacterium]